MDYYYKQPKYYSDFRCLGGNCPDTCCRGWQIIWYKNEYEKLINADCSDYLKELVEKSYKLSENENGNLYEIKLVSSVKDDTTDIIDLLTLMHEGKCPLHNEQTGLCDIQKELGEDYLGTVCRRYPRRYFQRGQIIVRMCSSACPAVNYMLINDKNAAAFEMTIARDFDKLEDKAVTHDPNEHIKVNPYLKYRIDILDFYVELFNKFVNVENSIILGALSAKKISEEDAEKIPGILKEYRKQFSSGAVLKSLQSIAPNYNIKYKIVNNLIYNYFGTRKDGIDISMLHNGEQLIKERYLQGMDNFNKAFEGREYAFRNIAINMFIYNFTDAFSWKINFWDYYSTFASYIAVLQVFACAVGYDNEDIENKFIKITSDLNRAMSHNKKKAEKVTNALKEIGLTTPAHLALIIK